PAKAPGKTSATSSRPPASGAFAVGTRKAPRRPTTFTPREVERPYGFPPETPELPAAYGEDRLVLMTRDPDTLFVYWEITPARRREAEQAMRRGERYQEALRLNWPAR